MSAKNKQTLKPQVGPVIAPAQQERKEEPLKKAPEKPQVLLTQKKGGKLEGFKKQIGRGKASTKATFKRFMGLVIGTTRIGRRWRLLGLFALVVSVTAILNVTAPAQGLGSNQPAIASNKQAATRNPLTPTTTMLSINADPQSDLDAKHASNSAYEFGERIWTYDYRYPDQYVSRLQPFLDPPMVDKVTMMSQSEQNKLDHLIQTGLITGSVTLHIDNNHTQATANLSVLVLVHRKTKTVDITPVVSGPTPLPSVLSGNLVHGQTYYDTTATPDTGSSDQTYQATSYMTVSMSVINGRWLVTAYKVTDKQQQ